MMNRPGANRRDLMPKTMCLFLGGAADGDRREIDDANEFVIRVFPTVASEEEITTNRSPDRAEMLRLNRVLVVRETYKRMLFIAEGKRFSVFVPEDWRSDEALKYMIDNYRKA